MSPVVLVADDNAVSRELVREVLETGGYAVMEAADGRDALETIERATPDLVLLDIQMPELDGFAVAGRLRASPRFRHLPIVALTACAMPGDRERALTAGFDGYITKPIHRAVLCGELERLLGTARVEEA